MSKFVLRVQSDLREVHNSYGHSSQCPPIFAAPVEDRLDCVRALLLGPPDTPYANGLFLVEVGFASTYPITPPRLKLLSTDLGRVRLNPNLYADGKVCLSILGTWRGASGEGWLPSYSLGYVLQCLQCVIMNGEPYYNEPGFEKGLHGRISAGQAMPFPGFSIGSGTAAPPATAPEAAGPPPGPSGEGAPEEEEGEGAAPAPAPTEQEGEGAAAAPAPKEEQEGEEAATEEEGAPSPKEEEEEAAAAASSPKDEAEGEGAAVPFPPFFSSPTAAGAAGIAGIATVAAAAAARPTLSEAEVATARQLVHHAAGSYAAKIGHEVLRVTVCELLESLYAGAAQLEGCGGRDLALGPLPAAVDFAPEVKRQFLLRYAMYVAAAEAGATIAAAAPGAAPVPVAEGQLFERAAFEGRDNGAFGKFAYAALGRRLRALRAAADAETQRWVDAGLEATARGSYAAGLLADEAQSLAADAVAGVSGGPVAPGNAFHWQMTFMPPDGAYSESAYTADVVFAPDGQPPRVRFQQAIHHPNVSPDGVPCYFHDEAAQPQQRGLTARYVAERLAGLLSLPPRREAAVVVNAEAAAQCFASNAAEARAFRRRARQMARRTME